MSVSWTSWDRPVEDYVNAFQRASGRSIALLDCDKKYNLANGVWGKASKILFGSNRKLSRFRLQSMWQRNTKGVRDIFMEHMKPFERTAAKRDVEYDESSFARCKPAATSTPLKNFNLTSDKLSIYCYCARKASVDEPSFVFCQTCNRWMHCLCNYVSRKQAERLKNWKCVKCNNCIRNPPSILRNVNWDNATFINLKAGVEYLSPETSPTDGPEHISPEQPIISDSEFEFDNSQNYNVHELSADERKSSENVAEDESITGARSFDSEQQYEPWSVGTVHESDAELGDKAEIRSEDVQKQRSTKFRNQEFNIDSDEGGSDSGSGTRRLGSESSSEDNDKQCPTKDDEVVEIYLSRQQRNFDIVIPEHKWQNIKPLPNTKSLQSNWVNYINTEFQKHIKCCVLKADYHKIKRKYKKTGASYFRGYCGCQWPTCPVKIYLNSPAEPQGKGLQVHVRIVGKILHPAREGHKIKCRRLNLEERDEAKRKMQNIDPSKLRNQLFGEADLDALQMGNYNVPKTLTVLRKAKSEANRQGDISKDPIDNLRNIKKDWDTQAALYGHKGYIRDLGADPLRILVYHEDAFEVLDGLRQYHQRHGTDFVIEVDATGMSLQRKLNALEDHPILYYAAVVQSHISGDPPLALAELITNDQSTDSIETIFRFFRKYVEKRRGSGDNFFVRHVEVDFSKAMLAAVVKTFFGRSTATYLDNVWSILEGSAEVDREGTGIHICRIHTSRFLFDAITRIYDDKDSQEFWINKWLKPFLYSRELNSICRRIRDVILIAGSRFKTDAVDAAILNISEPTKKIFKDEDVYRNFKYARDPNLPFNRRTKFGQFGHWLTETLLEDYQDDLRAVKRRKGLAKKSRKSHAGLDKPGFRKKKRSERSTIFGQHVNKETPKRGTPRNSVNRFKSRLFHDEENWLEENEYFNVEFVQYMILHVVPYAGILTRGVFEAFNIAFTTDHTNHAELLFNHLKRNFFKGMRSMSVARFVRELEKISRGKLNQCLAMMTNKKRKKHSAQRNKASPVASPRSKKETSVENDSEDVNPPKTKRMKNTGCNMTSGRLPKRSRSTSLRTSPVKKTENSSSEGEPDVNFQRENYFGTKQQKPLPRKSKPSASKTPTTQKPSPLSNTQPGPTPKNTSKKTSGISRGGKAGAHNSTPGSRSRTLLTPERQREMWGAKKDTNQHRKRAQPIITTLNLIPWGGTVHYMDVECVLSNTCSIDNQLQIMYALYEFFPAFVDVIRRRRGEGNKACEAIEEMCMEIREGDANNGRWIWIREIMNVNTPGRDQFVKGRQKYINFQANEESTFGIHLKGIFDLLEIRTCSICSSEILCSSFFPSSAARSTIEEHMTVMNVPYVAHRYSSLRKCCLNLNKVRYEFKDGIPIPVLRLVVDCGAIPGKGNSIHGLKEIQVPRQVILLGKNYRLFAVSLLHPERVHFTAIFYTGEGNYEYDGLNSKLSRVSRSPVSAFVQSVYYVYDQ